MKYLVYSAAMLLCSNLAMAQAFSSLSCREFSHSPTKLSVEKVGGFYRMAINDAKQIPALVEQMDQITPLIEDAKATSIAFDFTGDPDSTCVSGPNFLTRCEGYAALTFLDEKEQVVGSFFSAYVNLLPRFVHEENLWPDGTVDAGERVEFLVYLQLTTKRLIEGSFSLSYSLANCR